MNVLALEPYAADSHIAVLDALKANSAHAWSIESLPARVWKWRMRTASSWARDKIVASKPDVLFVSDYLDLAELRALLPRGLRDIPAVAYFHESQATYPLSTGERVDHQFAFTNLSSVRAADIALFNSQFHHTSFFDALAVLARRVPDLDFVSEVATAREHAEVLPLGTSVERINPRLLAQDEVPRILWAHRAEHDKGPDLLLRAVRHLCERGVSFELDLAGPRFRREPPEFAELAALLGSRFREHGFVPKRAAYLELAASAHITLSTARHEFFGLAALETLRAGCLPVWPAELAYPELLPRELHAAPLLYDSGLGAGPALEQALELVRAAAHIDPVSSAARSSDRFLWSHLTPRFDDALERAVT